MAAKTLSLRRGRGRQANHTPVPVDQYHPDLSRAQGQSVEGVSDETSHVIGSMELEVAEMLREASLAAFQGTEEGGVGVIHEVRVEEPLPLEAQR